MTNDEVEQSLEDFICSNSNLNSNKVILKMNEKDIERPLFPKNHQKRISLVEIFAIFLLIMFDTFHTLFDTLRSLLSSNEPIDNEKIQLINANRQNLLNIIANSPQNAAQRNALNRADIDGIQFDSLNERRKLPRLFIDECFAISDLFQLNEYDSLSLLIEGEALQASFPDCKRGLLAVQLYYESKERLAASLAYLMACINGRTFQSMLKANRSIEFCRTLVEGLVEQRLIENIIDQLTQFQLRNEEQKLYSKAGLGNVRHRRRVLDSIQHIRSFQAKSVFLYSCQIPLSQSHFLAIINYLSKHSTIQDDGIIDESTLYILAAFLYGITLTLTVPTDTTTGSTSIMATKHQQFSLQEDQPLSPLENTLARANSSIDPNLINTIRDLLSNDERWVIPEMKAVCQLAWSIILRARSHTLPDGHIYSEDIEALADTAVEAHVFAFLSETIIKSSLFQQEEFLIRRFHGLFVDFIYYLPFKLKELRVQAEDTARMIEDCERAKKPLPDNLQRDYEYFLELLSAFYGNDQMDLHLSEEFWLAADALAGRRMMQPPTQQQVALANFVESAGGTLSAYLYCHYIHMLAGISSTQSSAHACFELLRFAKDTGGPTCWNRIFQAFILYRNTYRPDTMLNQPGHTSFGSGPSAIKTIAPKEVTALIAVLNLIEVIAAQDEISRIGFFEHPQWQIIGAFFGLLSCRISLDLKAALFNGLSSFTKTPEIAMHFWKIIGDVDLFAPMENSDMPALAYEIEEFEVPAQRYTFLRSCLKFLQPIIAQQSRNNNDLRTLGFCVVFLVNHVLLKIPSRIFKSTQEKWQIVESVLTMINDIVTSYFTNKSTDDDSNEIKVISPGELILNDLFRGGILYNLLTSLITDGCTKLFEFVSFTGEQELSRSLILIMELLESVTTHGQQILQTDRSSNFAFCQMPIERMITDINTKDLFPNIMRLIDMMDYFPKLSYQALSVVAKALSEDKLQNPFLRLLPKDHEDKALLRNGLVRCLEYTEPDPENQIENINETDLKAQMRYTVLWLLTKSVQSNVGHFLCGFNRQHQLEAIDFYFTLTGRGSRVNNCLQAILTYFDDLSPLNINFYQRSLPLCYEVLYLLCTNHSNSVSRITFDLLHEHLFIEKQIHSYIPLKTTSTIFKHSIETYLLRLIAQELFHLVNEPTVISKSLIDVTINLLFELIDMKMNRLTLSFLSLPILKEDHNYLEQLKMPNIDLTKIQHILQACQYNERVNLKLYRLDSLKNFLANEIKTIQKANLTNNNNELINDIGALQENSIHDCKIILAYANQLNNEQIDFYWRNSHVDAWRSLIELILYLNLTQIKTFPFDLCQFLYEKILNQTHEILDDQQSSHLMNVFLTSIQSIQQMKSLGEHRTHLLIILKNLFDLIQSRFTGKGRSAIYGSIVQSIRIIEHLEINQQQDDLRRILSNAIQHNNHMLSIILNDVLANVSAVRSSASSLLTCLIAIDSSDLILNHINQTFLRSLETELRQLMCAVVQSLQTSGTVDLKTWHSFSSYMALLLRIASINQGAQFLVASNIFDALLPLMDFHTDTRRLLHGPETTRNGRWMFGRTLAVVIDLVVAVLMTNVRSKEKIYHFINQLTELVLKILASPLDSLCTLHEIDTVLKLIYTLDCSNDSNIHSLDGQIQRMRNSSLKILPMLSRDDLFRHLLSQSDAANGQKIIASTYWRTCCYMLTICIRLVHRNSTDLNEYLPAVLKLIEWIALNSKELKQEEKSILFNFCQMPIDRIVTIKGKQDLLIEMMKLIDSSSSLYNPN